METLQFVTLDVFTKTKYEGNPLAIIKVPCALRASLTQARKQLIAREFNLSETVFLHENRESDPKNEWTIDIFTKQEELPFAGHPIIGSACYVLNGLGTGMRTGGTFITKAGRIPLLMEPSRVEGEWGSVQADIPHDVHIHRRTLADLRKPIPWLSRSPILAKAEIAASLVSIVKGMTFLLVQVDTLEALAEVVVAGTEWSFDGLLDQEEGWDEGFVARYYFIEIPSDVDGLWHELGKEVQRVRTRMVEATMEDPATGSAACALGAFLALREGRSKRFEVTQGVEMGRRSVIGVEAVVNSDGDGDGGGRRIESVKLSGSAVLVMEGSVRV